MSSSVVTVSPDEGQSGAHGATEHPAITQAREDTRLPRWFWLAAVLVLFAVTLPACGGGDPEPDVPPPGVDCKAHPEQCI